MKKFAFVFVIALALCPRFVKSQTLQISVTPSVQCFEGFGLTTASCAVVSTPPATSYSWSAGTMPGSCAPSISLTASNGSVIGISYPCCGSYTFICTAYSGTSIIGMSFYITNVICSPNIMVMGDSVICSGMQSSLTVSGAQNYTWSTGATGNSVVVSPTTSTTYTVAGIDPSGCSGNTSFFVNLIPTVTPGFTYSVSNNGLVNFTNTTTNAYPPTGYNWSFGNGLTSNLTSPSTTYSANGTYSVTLSASSICGPASVTQTILVNSVPSPSCNANFTFNINPGGFTTFNSTSTGTLVNTAYNWNFGNGFTHSGTGTSGTNPSTTYSSGIYTITLSIMNSNPYCISSVSTILNLSVCSLTPNFTSSQTGTSTMDFTSTSAGTVSGTIYNWSFGDGQNGTGIITTHTYSNPGVYVVSLAAINDFSCSSVKTSTITIANCLLLSDFAHTVSTNGAVQFNNISSNTNLNTHYYWNFGDGVFSRVANPTHTYSNAGNYLVTLKTTDSLSRYCYDSIVKSLNITNVPCSANSGFTVTPTGTPQFWNATPAYPYNIIAAQWLWGDGTSSNVLYTSHTYSTAGTYTICLSVTVSCGATSSYCFPYTLSESNSINTLFYNINVVPPGMTNGLESYFSENTDFSLSPNPNAGSFKLNATGVTGKEISVSVYSLIGEQIYHSLDPAEYGQLEKSIDLENINSGIYFVAITSGAKTITKKIIVSK